MLRTVDVTFAERATKCNPAKCRISYDSKVGIGKNLVDSFVDLRWQMKNANANVNANRLSLFKDEIKDPLAEADVVESRRTTRSSRRRGGHAFRVT